MKITRIDIKRDDSILQVENWPTTLQANVSISSQVELVIESESNVTTLHANASTVMSGPVCQDGVCQLGSWKPKRDAA